MVKNISPSLCLMLSFVSVGICSKCTYIKHSHSFYLSEQEQNFEGTCYNVSSDFSFDLEHENATLIDELTISESKIPIIPSNSSLSSFTLLKKLVLRSASIEKVTLGAFVGLDKLEKLDLTTNRISELVPGTFTDLINLKYLFLAENLLTKISVGVFSNLKSIQWLELSNNLINDISADSFSDLIQLKYFFLRANNITVLPEGLFRNATNLEIAAFGRNPLKSIHGVGFSADLKTIDIEWNDLEHFDADLSDVKKLEYFDVSDGHLKEIDFAKLPMTENLDLDKNLISTLKNFDIAKADILRLNHNKIKELNSIPKYVGSLQLRHNKIKYVTIVSEPDSYNISYLDLSFNKLEVASCFGLSKLKALNLDHNQITSVKEHSFAVCSNLFSLSLKNNKIENLDLNAFRGADSLNYIELSKNNLRMLDPDVFLGLSNLMNLYVNENQIAYLDVDGIVRNVPELKRIRVKNNTYSCDDANIIFKKLRWYQIHSDIKYVNYKKCKIAK